jgi:hypothetical protein
MPVIKGNRRRLLYFAIKVRIEKLVRAPVKGDPVAQAELNCKRWQPPGPIRT